MNDDNTTQLIINEYSDKLDKDLKYSLEVDPENKYNLKDHERTFIKCYTQTKSIAMAKECANVDDEEAKRIYFSYAAQSEIKRINLAMYHRQFMHKLLTIDEIGGWLSSLITDSNLAEADKLTTKDKLKVAEMLLNLHKDKENIFNKPEIITYKDYDEELKNLSVDSLKLLLETSKSNEKRDEILSQFNLDELSNEEVALLKSMSTEDLLELLNSLTK